LQVSGRLVYFISMLGSPDESAAVDECLQCMHHGA